MTFTHCNWSVYCLVVPRAAVIGCSEEEDIYKRDEMNCKDALRDICKLTAFGGEDPNSLYYRSLQLKELYIAAAMKLRRCWVLNAQDPNSKHHNSYCAAWEAYLQVSEESRAESVRQAEILEKAKQLREELKKKTTPEDWSRTSARMTRRPPTTQHKFRKPLTPLMNPR